MTTLPSGVTLTVTRGAERLGMMNLRTSSYAPRTGRVKGKS